MSIKKSRQKKNSAYLDLFKHYWHWSYKGEDRTAAFTLIEMIIAVGLFSLLVLLVVSAFVYLGNIQHTVDSKQQVISDLRNDIDIMSKEITNGSSFPNGCTHGCPVLSFATKPRADMPLRVISYQFDSHTGTLLKAEQKTFGLCSHLPFDPKCYVPFTSDKVKINNFSVFVNNKGKNQYPIITYVVDGTALTGTQYAETFSISSSVTARLLQDPSTDQAGDFIPPTIAITDPTSADTYVSSAATIVLGGNAHDDGGGSIAFLRWRNQTTSESGFIDASSPNWTSPDIPLAPSVDNIIFVEAEDTAGLKGLDMITVTSTRPPPPPDPLSTLYITQQCDTGIVWIGYCYYGSGQVNIYRCNGLCTPVNDDLLSANANGCSYYQYADTGADIGSTYTYDVKIHDTLSGLYSIFNTSGPQSFTVQPTDPCPPPAPPPPPPDPTPDPPVNLSAECSIDNTHATLSWDPVSDAAFYALRVNYTFNDSDPGCSSWYCASPPDLSFGPSDPNGPVTGTSMTVPIVEGAPYTWWVVSMNASQGYSGYTSGSFTCGTPLPPPPPPPPSSPPIYFKLTPVGVPIISVGVGGNQGLTQTSTKIQITIKSFNGFSEAVTLPEIDGLPGDATVHLSPSIVPASSLAVGTSFWVSLPDDTPLGTYTLTVHAISSPSGLNDSTTIYLDVRSKSGGES